MNPNVGSDQIVNYINKRLTPELKDGQEARVQFDQLKSKYPEDYSSF